MASEASPQSTAPALSLVASGDLLEEQYARWREDPSSVPEDWRLLFTGFELGLGSEAVSHADHADAQSRVASLIFAYRSLGHIVADVDPLGDRPKSPPELDPEAFGLGADDLGRVFDTGHLGGPQRASLAEIVAILRETYCGKIGVEYLHMQDRAARRWLQAEMEPTRNHPSLSREQRLDILRQLIDAELFESFIHTRYPGQKRFSLEGAESLIPALHALVESAAAAEVEEIVAGMAHRGRLNVLANILHKPYAMIFDEFEDTARPERVGGDGDVRYHRGYSSTCVSSTGRVLHFSLTANPSHLEAVDPVVEGRARAKQRRHGDTVERRKVLPLLIHGDAAFAGQGLVAETLNLSQLKGYRTGGTLHLVVNNQIGFTTSPGEARSSRYPTDVAKLVEAPIFHVNGEDPEAVVRVVDLALRFRQRFQRDVVVDMICYRKHGHNESDEPAFTQPLMYQKIRNRPSVRMLYQLQLESEGVLSLDDSARASKELKERLYAAFKSVREGGSHAREEHAFSGVWSGLDRDYSFEPAATAVEHEALLGVARALTTVPDGFRLNPKIARRLPARLEAVEQGGTVDWALAEALAFGTLLREGVPVRLSGQDSIRGTFSQRHAAWWDASTQEMYIPLAHIAPEQARFCVYNSMLSEAAVLGFDYGYSLVEPQMLVVWEAQFGDFANGAQVIIDQFVAASLDKWERACGLVMLLPHGYEGQGPEHSSAYLERYLALCAEDNLQVCNLTTPAQYFHALRRQVKRPFRRPLVVMAPKSLLRHRRAVSSVAELTGGGFAEVLDDPSPPTAARRLVLCSGRIFYPLVEAREEAGIDDVAIVRLEQLYPLDLKALARVVAPYRDAEEVAWVQEETENRGAWAYIAPKLLELLDGRRPRYIGRPPSASPATAYTREHREQEESILSAALSR